MTYSDWMLALATIAGPILAVQAQKWVERSRGDKNRKLHVFEMIMSTRRDQLSFEHKRALNMIDYVFVKNAPVINAWHNYFDHLCLSVTPESFPAQLTERNRLFIEMLRQMSIVVGYKFDDRILQSGYYSPQAHVDLEENQRKIMSGLVNLLEGQPLNMAVTSFAVDQNTLDVQLDLQRKLASTITDSGEMKIILGNSSIERGEH